MFEYLESYRGTIQRAQELDCKYRIWCTQPKHAVEICNLFFRKAEGEILIFQNQIQREIFDNPEVIREMERAVYRKVSVELIAQRPDEGSKFLERLETPQARNPYAHYFEIPKNTQANRIDSENFLVVDSKAYRIQHEDGKAEAYFNNPKIARQLAERFVSIRRRLEGIRSA